MIRQNWLQYVLQCYRRVEELDTASVPLALQTAMRRGGADDAALRRATAALKAALATYALLAVNNYDMTNSYKIAYAKQETPTRGRQITVLEQLLGNVGRGGPRELAQPRPGLARGAAEHPHPVLDHRRRIVGRRHHRRQEEQALHDSAFRRAISGPSVFDQTSGVIAPTWR